MPRTMIWLPAVIRVAIAPVFLGVVILLVEPSRSVSDVAAAVGLLLLGAIHVVFWWRPGTAAEELVEAADARDRRVSRPGLLGGVRASRTPWPTSQRRAVAAAVGMVLVNFVLLNLLGLNQPLLWLYPALIAGAGLRAPAAVVGVALTAMAAAAPIALEGGIVEPLHPLQPFGPTLGPSHSILLSIVLAGLGMTAVRQLIALNGELHATRAELADLAVADERERLARELHDLLGRTLSLIAVKAELASRLSARGDLSAEAELADVQLLARQAVRDVREAVTGAHAPSVEAELAEAAVALRAAGIEVDVVSTAASIDPAHETAIAWALREAVTNVVKHSGAHTCRIALDAAEGCTTLNVEDDGRGAVGGGTGTGLDGLANRVHALGGSIEFGPREPRGFRLRVELGAAVLPRPGVETAR
jgi:two-component system sensor histidine kinase DesK